MKKHIQEESFSAITADGKVYASDKEYYFYDPGLQEIRTTVGLRQDGEYLWSFGFKVVPINELRTRRREAVRDGRKALRDEIKGIRERMDTLSR